ncbi:MAG: hypothetical protein ACWA5Q_09880, partial [bacterium]
DDRRLPTGQFVDHAQRRDDQRERKRVQSDRGPQQRLESDADRVEIDADGNQVVRVHPSRSSGVLSSVAWANGLVDIAEGQSIARGDSVSFIPFPELLT